MRAEATSIPDVKVVDIEQTGYRKWKVKLASGKKMSIISPLLIRDAEDSLRKHGKVSRPALDPTTPTLRFNDTKDIWEKTLTFTDAG